MASTPELDGIQHGFDLPGVEIGPTWFAGGCRVATWGMAWALMAAGCLENPQLELEACGEGSEPLLFRMHRQAGYGTDAAPFDISSLGRNGEAVRIWGSPAAGADGFARPGTGKIVVSDAALSNITKEQIERNLKDVGRFDPVFDYNISKAFRAVLAEPDQDVACTRVMAEFYEFPKIYRADTADGPALVMAASTRLGEHVVVDETNGKASSELELFENQFKQLFDRASAYASKSGVPK